MKALDLFSGLGGWSDGLSLEGFDILGVEIEPKIVKLYKHDCIIADVTSLDGSRFKEFDLIVGSPPCRDFSVTGNFGKVLWKIPPNPKEGLKLVNAFLRIVKEAEPTYWLMENVPQLSRYIDLKPRNKTKLGRTMKRCFWGNFPAFLIPRDFGKGRFSRDPKSRLCWNWDNMAKWYRAYIPLTVSRALGKAVREALE